VPCERRWRRGPTPILLRFPRLAGLYEGFRPHKLLRHIAGILVKLRLGPEPPKIFVDRARLSLGLSPDDLVSGALP
jgi:hypothetical protein